MTLGIGDLCPQTWSVLQGPAVLAFVVPPFWDGLGWIWLEESYTFLVRFESNVRHWEPVPAGLVRLSGPCCFGVRTTVVLGWGAVRALLLGTGESAVCGLWRGWKRLEASYRQLVF